MSLAAGAETVLGRLKAVAIPAPLRQLTQPSNDVLVLQLLATWKKRASSLTHETVAHNLKVTYMNNS